MNKTWILMTESTFICQDVIVIVESDWLYCIYFLHTGQISCHISYLRSTLDSENLIWKLQRYKPLIMWMSRFSLLVSPAVTPSLAQCTIMARYEYARDKRCQHQWCSASLVDMTWHVLLSFRQFDTIMHSYLWSTTCKKISTKVLRSKIIRYLFLKH